MKKVFFPLLLLFFIQGIFAQIAPNKIPAARQSFDLTDYGVRLEPDRRLIVVMASLEAAREKNGAGEDAPIISPPLTAAGIKFRQRLSSDLSGLNDDLRQKITLFVKQYKRRHANLSDAELSASFLSLAYALSPVPNLDDPPRNIDLPANLLEVFDYAPLVREFYRRSGIAAKLDGYVKEYQANGETLRPSASLMVRRMLDYLHTKPELTYSEKVVTQSKDAKGKKTLTKTELREHERRFFIVPDLLAAQGTINFRNIGDDYYVIVPPGANLISSDVRRAYLQFVLDPLVLRNAKDIATFKDDIKTLLDERRRANPDISPDIYLAVSRSLVAAADARENEYGKTQIATAQARQKIDAAKGDAAKRAVSAELNSFRQSLADDTALELSEAYERGAVLAFYFAEQLKGLEDSGFDISGSFREYVLSLDPAREASRVAQFAEARKRAETAREERRRKPIAPADDAAIARSSVISNQLLEIENFTADKNYTEAQARLTRLLEENPNESRIYYALGRVSSLSAQTAFDESLRDKRLEEAAVYYGNAIRSATDATDKGLVSLSYVALGRIFEFWEKPDAAMKQFDAAVKLGDVEGGAYKEALAGKERLAKK